MCRHFGTDVTESIMAQKTAEKHDQTLLSLVRKKGNHTIEGPRRTWNSPDLSEPALRERATEEECLGASTRCQIKTSDRTSNWQKSAIVCRTE